eukprot:275991_1
MAAYQLLQILLILVQLIDTAKYIFIEQRISHDEASSYCQNSYGTTLASIHSLAANEEASGLCQSSCPSCTRAVDHGCWIGLNDKGNERDDSPIGWVWPDGSPFDWESWRSGEPHDEPSGGSSTDRDCVYIYPANHPINTYRRMWADVECIFTAYFLCNHPPTPKPTAAPTNDPSQSPTNNPSNSPSITPSLNPSQHPTNNPTQNPTTHPSNEPSCDPIHNPTNHPSTNVPTLSIDMHDHAHINTTANFVYSTFEDKTTIDVEIVDERDVCGSICVATAISAVVLVVIGAMLIVLYKLLRKEKEVVIICTSSREKVDAVVKATTNETMLARHVDDNASQTQVRIIADNEAKKKESDSDSDRMYENTKGAPISTRG